MAKRFLASGLESGMRFRRAASGKDIRKEAMSLTRLKTTVRMLFARHAYQCRDRLSLSPSSVEAPMLEARASKA